MPCKESTRMPPAFHGWIGIDIDIDIDSVCVCNCNDCGLDGELMSSTSTTKKAQNLTDKAAERQSKSINGN